MLTRAHAVAIALALAATAHAAAPFTNRVSIETRLMVDPAGHGLHLPKFSPDGKRLAFVTRRPDIASKTIEYQLHALSAEDVRRYLLENGPVPAPKVLATSRSASARAAISQVGWLPDGRSLAFLAEAADGTITVNAVDASSGALTRLASHENRIITFDTNGNELLLIVELPSPPPTSEDVVTVTDQKIAEILTPAEVTSGYFPGPTTRYQTLVIPRPGEAPRPVPRSIGRKYVHGSGGNIDNARRVWLSPNGRYAVELRYVTSVPRAWERFTYQPGKTRLGETQGEVGEAGVGLVAFRYVVVDLQSGDIVQDLAAPTGSAVIANSPPNALWAADSRSVVIAGTFLPDDVGEGKPEASNPAVVEVDLATRKVSVIARMPAYSRDTPVAVHVHRSSGGGLQLAEFANYRLSERTPEVRAFERRAGGEWIERAKETYAAPFWLRRLEDINKPIQYLVQWTGSDAPAKLLADLNPQLAGVEIVPAEKYSWKDSRGEPWEGVVLAPERCKAGGCPLVIQTHGNPPRFLLDGPGVFSNTAFAARALASEGIVVLQMQDKLDVQQKPDEADRYLDGYRSAVAALHASHRIDPKRVGAVGFSRTCYHVKHAAVFGGDLLRAAVVADGVDFGYAQYLYIVPGPNRKGVGGGHTEFQNMYGGHPFGELRSTWHAKAPASNVERVSTAFMMQATGPGSLWGEWEFFAGLRARGTPAELHFFRDIDHPLVRVGPRYKSQELAKDWLAYWLLGREDADPEKASQYARWQELRRLDPRQAKR